MLEESPTAFGSDHHEALRRPLSHFRDRAANEPENFIIGAFLDGELIGSAGGRREQAPKRRHIASIVGMYVHPHHRGTGLGRKLLDAVLERLEVLPGVEALQLEVTAGNEAALKLYESAGFSVYGREPAALKVAGVDYDELRLSRPLRSDA